MSSGASAAKKKLLNPLDARRKKPIGGDALLDDDVDVDASIGPFATFVTTCVHMSGLVLLCVDDDLAAPPQGAFETSLSAARDDAGAAALVVASAAVSICAAAGHETASAALVAGEAPAHR